MPYFWPVLTVSWKAFQVGLSRGQTRGLSWVLICSGMSECFFSAPKYHLVNMFTRYLSGPGVLIWTVNETHVASASIFYNPVGKKTAGDYLLAWLSTMMRSTIKKGKRCCVWILRQALVGSGWLGKAFLGNSSQLRFERGMKFVQEKFT
jgi:hypothetical protein